MQLFRNITSIRYDEFQPLVVSSLDLDATGFSDVGDTVTQYQGDAANLHANSMRESVMTQKSLEKRLNTDRSSSMSHKRIYLLRLNRFWQLPFLVTTHEAERARSEWNPLIRSTWLR